VAEVEKAAAIDGSTGTCEPTVRAVPFAFGQLPQTVPVVLPFDVVTSNCDSTTAAVLPL